MLLAVGYLLDWYNFYWFMFMFMQFAHYIFNFFQIDSWTSRLNFLDCKGLDSRNAI
jgi:hypothetical protein